MQLIYWRESPNTSVKIYRLTTVTYGTASAPFLATNTLNSLANEVKKEAPEAANIMKKDFYVDDLMTGAQTVEKTITLHD